MKPSAEVELSDCTRGGKRCKSFQSPTSKLPADRAVCRTTCTQPLVDSTGAFRRPPRSPSSKITSTSRSHLLGSNSTRSCSSV